MPGQWVLDDSQSLYYLESEDVPGKVSTEQLQRPLSQGDEAEFRHPDKSSTTYQQRVPIRHQNKTARWGSTVTASDSTPPSFKRPRLSSEGDLLRQPFASGSAHDSSLLDWDRDIRMTNDDAFSTPASTATAATTNTTATGVFAPTLPPVLEISRHHRARSLESASTISNHRHTERAARANRHDECDKSQKEAQQAITRALARLDRATLFDYTFAHPLSSLNLIMGFNTSLPKSRLDTYITALRQLLRCSAERCILSNELQRAITAEGVLWVVREAWPAAEGYWNLTATFRGFLHAELWRNFPCQRSYNQLPPAYRPTRAQLSVPHSPMIDWMPWPDVRDMAIMYQDQIDVDALFRMAIHNVVAHRKRRPRGRTKTQSSSLPTMTSSSSLLRKDDDDDGRSATTTTPIYRNPDPAAAATEHDDDNDNDNANDKTSFRVWDLVCLEKAHGTNPLAEPGLDKKPVLRSPGVRALLRAYDLEYDEFDTQKLDDCFFEAYPCLYADTAASAWKVKSFPSLPHEDVGRPVALTQPAVFRLKARIEAMIGAEIEI
ncbi:uncharacterized protein PV07_10732 [Cladophialophora immunda]|uniref:Uncharacterized protein n=1 Tax=Cladophialophora immunda TaxID=569365 RepID=A0A0D2C3P9_9EURO|nr:uncharacterized protein PV07_10732 [Cladophialophora immunda]KIW25060.1 hypothetical protein PV07_10732 [Cladophialophora immunda]OQU96553.1 hypothetical protein CLAIMM_02619 isoform 1 [Cladophialophora immunda]OQU96554.1 hypothetical protein CLAIMM_02619 isoform 2 [Cladophialophora immunda]